MSAVIDDIDLDLLVDIYARVSRASDKNETSTPSQLVAGRIIAADLGLIVGCEHVDPGKSAWDVKRERPGWEAMMARVEAGLVRSIIVFELTRFARRSEDGLRLLKAAEMGVRVIDSEAEYDLTKARDRKTFRDAISANEFESDMISLRTKRGKKSKVRDRKLTNSSSRAFGYEPGNIVQRKAEADELRLAVKRMLDEGWSQEDVCRDWNARGVPTAGKAEAWRPTALRATLLRPGVVGDIDYAGEVLHVGAFPGVLDRETYNRLQAMYATRRRGRPATSLGSGFVVCFNCRKGMHCKTYNQRRCVPYPDGTPMRVYICEKRYGRGCSQAIDQRAMDAFLVELAIERLSDPEIGDRMAAKAAATDSELSKVQQKITEVQASLAKVDARWAAGEISDERHEKLTEGMEERLVKLEADQKRLIGEAPARAVVASAASRRTWEKRFKAAELDQTREYIAAALGGAKVRVLPGLRMADVLDRVAALD